MTFVLGHVVVPAQRLFSGPLSIPLKRTLIDVGTFNTRVLILLNYTSFTYFYACTSYFRTVQTELNKNAMYHRKYAT